MGETVHSPRGLIQPASQRTTMWKAALLWLGELTVHRVSMPFALTHQTPVPFPTPVSDSDVGIDSRSGERQLD